MEMPKRNYSLKREEKELTPEMLYTILFRMYGNDIALKEFKELTGEDYKGEIIEEPDLSEIFEVNENG